MKPNYKTILFCENSFWHLGTQEYEKYLKVKTTIQKCISQNPKGIISMSDIHKALKNKSGEATSKYALILCSWSEIKNEPPLFCIRTKPTTKQKKGRYKIRKCIMLREKGLEIDGKV